MDLSFSTLAGLGGSVVEGILEFGAQIAQVIGPEFDLLSFDPRGKVPLNSSQSIPPFLIVENPI